MAIYLLIPECVAGVAARTQRTWNPLVATIARDGAETGTAGRSPLLPQLKCALYQRLWWWAPGDSNPEPAD